MSMRSSREMVAVLVFLVFVLPACTLPNAKLSEPPGLSEISSSRATGTTNLVPVLSAIKKAAGTYDTMFVPPVTELNKVTANFSFFISMFTGCDEMKKPIENSLRGAQVLQVELLKAKNTLLLSSPTTDKEKQIVAAGDELIMKMGEFSTLVLRDLVPDDSAYFASCQGRIMTQLNPENGASHDKTSREVEAAPNSLAATKNRFLATLN